MRKKKLEFEKWFSKLSTYFEDHFVDKKNGGDIFGYLSRQGEVLLRLKGGKWKGFFHSPRCFLLLHKIFQEIKSTK